MEAAAGIIEVANATMIRAIKLISVERGYDPRDFTLIAFGGAGPLHALRLAEELEFPVVIVPRYPGNTSALGLVLADVRHDFGTTWIQRLEQAEPARIERVFQELEKQAIDQLEEDGIPPEQRLLNRYCDLRYFGQGFEVNVPVGEAVNDKNDLETIIMAFHAAHRRAFGHAMEGDPVEVVNFRVSATGLSLKPDLRASNHREAGEGIEAARKGEREVYLEGDFNRCPVYERSLLKPGMQIKGPAVVEQSGSTTLILPRYSAHVDVSGSLTITIS
jgi:N-methylhydantoinase A